MRRRPSALIVALAVLSVGAGGLLTGCGGGGATERLSGAAVGRQAARICAAGQKEADRLRGEAVPGAHGEAAAREIDATIEALDTQIEGFADLRGPAATDDDVAALVRHLRAAAAGLTRLREVTVADDLTVDEAVQANPKVVRQVNRSSAQAADDLVALDWLTCLGTTG